MRNTPAKDPKNKLISIIIDVLFLEYLFLNVGTI